MFKGQKRRANKYTLRVLAKRNFQIISNKSLLLDQYNWMICWLKYFFFFILIFLKPISHFQSLWYCKCYWHLYLILLSIASIKNNIFPCCVCVCVQTTRFKRCPHSFAIEFKCAQLNNIECNRNVKKMKIIMCGAQYGEYPAMILR